MSRFYGIYRAVVFDNNDPNGLGRLRLTIPQVLSDVATGWCWPANASGLEFGIPAVGQGVWVSFEGGDPSFPIWTGVFGNEMSTNTKVSIKPMPSGTKIPYNFIINKTVDGKNSLDLISSLINVASVIDGGSA